MNKHARLGWTTCSARLCAAASLAALFALGCSDGNGGSGGSTSTGGAGGTTGATGGTGGTGGAGGSTGGAGGSTLPTCESLQIPTYHVNVALHETQKPWKEPQPGSPSTFTVSGTVDGVGSGPLAQSCGHASAGTDGAWISIIDANGTSWRACYAGPGASMPVVVSDVVDITLNVAWYGFGSASSSLTVRKQDALMLFALEDESSDLTPPPEISIVNGEKVCDGGDASYCSMDGYIAVVTVGGEQSEMTAGNTSMIGGYNIHLGSWGSAKYMLVCDGPVSEHYLFAVPAP